MHTTVLIGQLVKFTARSQEALKQEFDIGNLTSLPLISARACVSFIGLVYA